MTARQLRRVRWAIRVILVLGIAASVIANVLHALDNPISKAIAAWPPLALLLTIELISRVPVHRRSLAAGRLLATAGIAGIAAYVSYVHMLAVAARYGETGASPYLLPLSVDGLVVVASISLVEINGRIRAAGVTQPEPAPAPQAVTVKVGPVYDYLRPVGPMPAPAGGAPGASGPAGQDVRQDARVTQDVDDAVRALRASLHGWSQRRIASVLQVPEVKVRRTLRAEPAQPAKVNGNRPDLELEGVQ